MNANVYQTFDDSIEYEITASLMMKPELVDDVSLDYTEFSNPNAGLVYRAIRYYVERGDTPTPALIATQLAKRIDTETLMKLCDITIAQPWALKDLAKRVRNESRRRKLLKATLKLREIADTFDEIDENAIAEMESAVAEVTATTDKDIGFLTIGEIMDEHIKRIEKRRNRNGKLIGVSTGFGQLNRQTGGYCKTDFNVIAARPSMGKSALMIQSALAVSETDVAAIFSLEMSIPSIADRIIASSTRTDMYKLRNGNISDNQLEAIKAVKQLIASDSLMIDATPAITPEYIRSQVRKLKKRIPKDKQIVIFADYLQIMQYAQKTRSRAEEVGKISSELKAIAKSLNVCIVALAQLNRNVEHAQDKRPTLADIRESGQIEQDADIVMLLYRDDYYTKPEEESNTADLEIIIAKNRNGERGTAVLKYNKDTQRIYEITSERSDSPA